VPGQEAFKEAVTMKMAEILERAACAGTAGAQRILIIGAGDEQHHDDGVGHAVVRRLCRDNVASDEPLATTDRDRMAALRERWRHADVVILVAATHSDPSHPGRIHLLTTDLPINRDPMSRGGQLVRELSGTPRRVTVYVVEGANFTPGTGISESVAAAMDTLVNNIGHEIDNVGGPDPGSLDAGQKAS
jgi:hydrogenase maturation protease